MNPNAAKTMPGCKREHVLIFFTTLILASTVAAIVVTDAFPLAVAEQLIAKSKPPETPAESSKGKNAATQPGEKASAATVREIVGVSVHDANLRFVAEAEPQEPPMPNVGVAAIPSASKLATAPHSPYSEFVGPIILTAVALFALAIVSILVLVLCVLGLLRWHGGRYGPLIRIEHLGAAPTAAANPHAALEPAPTPRYVGSSPSLVREPPPSDSSAQRQQDPLVRRLFEEALQLQTDIDLARKTANIGKGLTSPNQPVKPSSPAA